MYFIKNPEQRKHRTTILVSFIVSVCLILGYITVNKIQNDFFGISVVSPMNRFYDVVLAGIYNDNSDLKIVSEIQQRIIKNQGPLGVGIDVERIFSEKHSCNEVF